MKKISTENLSLLPPPTELQKICKSIATLEAILCQEWEYRYYSYQKQWSDTEEVCEMRNGEGNQMLILFTNQGACINGFAHESVANTVGILDGLPDMFHEFMNEEPVKSMGTTFCIWQTDLDSAWKTRQLDLPNNDYKDGSSDLLQLLDGNPSTYKNWAEEYYDINLSLTAIESIFKGATVTQELVNQLNLNLEDFSALKSDLEEIGFHHDL